ncbi:pyridoxal-phosphate dependent enzyme [Candidatus Poriferisodalis sp.]|uniref:pyridoxal-phosphate dependent enzyme n=1 Tax=Candidatus Poriferisodalis sp. TaxID=3101277 RepID=UPI003B01C195
MADHTVSPESTGSNGTAVAFPASYAAQLATDVTDSDGRAHVVERFREQGIRLPTFAELADPSLIDPDIDSALADVDPDFADPLNLFRVHWFNDGAGGRTEVPEHVVLPSELTGTDAQVVVLFGNRFPMIGAHKVLAAYSCLAPRVVSGQFDPTRHRAVWPSTGNYARGGVAISRIMACRGVAVLPENMSRERFEWLARWVAGPTDVIRTPGSESNVKEIYDACAELSLDPANFILNQFSEFSNHIGHYEVTGAALLAVFEHLRQRAATGSEPNLAAFVAASGSAGTLGAGDQLKDAHGAQIVAVEALECPTMLYNGYGEHNIQGIGDKHIPLIHNVMNTDVIVGVSDRATDGLGLVFNTEPGRDALREHLGAASWVLDELGHFGYSSICNTLAAARAANELGLGADDVVMTVATDGFEMYYSERERHLAERYPDSFDAGTARGIIERHLAPDARSDDAPHIEVLSDRGRDRIFNLGYYTWVEQQGVPLEDFEARRDQAFWDSLRGLPRLWDEMINELNDEVAATFV